MFSLIISVMISVRLNQSICFQIIGRKIKSLPLTGYYRSAGYIFLPGELCTQDETKKKRGMNMHSMYTDVNDQLHSTG